MKRNLREVVVALSGLVVGAVGLFAYFWTDAGVFVNRAIDVYCMAPESERLELREKFNNQIVINCEDEEDETTNE